MLSIGCCADTRDIRQIKEAGFDYIELPLNMISSFSEEEFGNLRSQLTNLRLDCLACNVFFPGAIRVTGEMADHEAALRYSETALARAAELGCRVVVLGSSRARTLAPSFSHLEGMSQFVYFAQACGEVAARNNLVIALEPLNRTETNLLNSVDEGVRLVREIGHPAVRLLADYYHMQVEKESLGSIYRAREYLVHAHTANLIGRSRPTEQDRDENLAFLTALVDIGYRGGISVEASGALPDADELRRTKACLSGWLAEIS